MYRWFACFRWDIRHHNERGSISLPSIVQGSNGAQLLSEVPSTSYRSFLCCNADLVWNGAGGLLVQKEALVFRAAASCSAKSSTQDRPPPNEFHREAVFVELVDSFDLAQQIRPFQFARNGVTQ